MWSSILLNHVNKNHELQVKQTSRRYIYIYLEREKYKTPVKSTSKALVKVQKNSVKKSIPQLEIR